MRNLKLIIGIVFASLMVFSCSNNGSSNKAADEIDDVAVKDVSNVVDNMPVISSYEIIELLNKSGAGYIFDITNPSDNIEKYISYKQKAINLGIYTADLTYSSTYQKKDETSNYLDNFVELVNDLEITTLNQAFFESIQNNLDNKDSLVLIIKEAQGDTYKFLNETGKDDLALYAIIGSYIEGLYLTGVTINFAENKKPLLELLLKNRKSLILLIATLDSYDDKDGNFKELKASLKEINDLFNKVEVEKNDENIQKLKDGIIEFRNTLI
jgi:hypothetical protein